MLKTIYTNLPFFLSLTFGYWKLLKALHFQIFPLISVFGEILIVKKGLIRSKEGKIA
jgi:hypothetical protein